MALAEELALPGMCRGHARPHTCVSDWIYTVGLDVRFVGLIFLTDALHLL